MNKVSIVQNTLLNPGFELFEDGMCCQSCHPIMLATFSQFVHVLSPSKVVSVAHKLIRDKQMQQNVRELTTDQNVTHDDTPSTCRSTRGHMYKFRCQVSMSERTKGSSVG